MRTARSCRLTSSASRACYDDATAASQLKVVNQKIRKAIESEGRLKSKGCGAVVADGAKYPGEPSAALRISRDRARWKFGAARGKRTVACRPDIERSGKGEKRSPGVSPAGRENGRYTSMHLN
jgi:hypothetical protein